MSFETEPGISRMSRIGQQISLQFGYFIASATDPSTPFHRYIALGLICLLGFGNYFCYDVPGALEKQIEAALEVTTSEFTSLYALYSWPNVLMCFFGGILIDRVLGIRLGAIVFLSLLVIGQFVFAFGAFWKQFWMMQLGRFIFGLGGESLSVAQNTYVVAWFKGYELNMVFGFQISVSRAGSTLAYNTMHPIYDHFTHNNSPLYNALGYAMMIAGLTCVASFLFSIVLALLDKRAERILERPAIQSDENFSLKDVTCFKSEFWMLNIICISFYITIFPFISLASKFFQNKWHYNQDEANFFSSMVYVISAISSPFIGLLVDKVGRNLVFLTSASVIVMLSHMLMAVTVINLWFSMISLGIGYSIMCSSLWPLVAIVVPQHQLGTAYGVMQAIQNFGLALAANFTGVIVDQAGYINLELFFVLFSGISVIFSIVLIVMDKANGGALNRTAKERIMIESGELDR